MIGNLQWISELARLRLLLKATQSRWRKSTRKSAWEIFLMIGCSLFLGLLLTVPLLMNALLPAAKGTVLVGLEVAIALTTALVTFIKSTQQRDKRVQAKLLLLTVGMVSLACAEGLCNVAFLQGDVRVRGETYAEVFYIGFWAALAGFMRWRYGPLWTGRKWWAAVCAGMIFPAASYMQIRFVLRTSLPVRRYFAPFRISVFGSP